MSLGRSFKVIVAALLLLVGASFLLTAFNYGWMVARWPEHPSFGPGFMLVIGQVAIFYLLAFGLFPAILVLVVLGICCLLLAYIVLRRGRGRSN
jgi:hypothetical protein